MLHFIILAYDLLSQAEMTFERIANYCRPFRIFTKLFLSMILRFSTDLKLLCWIDFDVLLIMNLYPFWVLRIGMIHKLQLMREIFNWYIHWWTYFGIFYGCLLMFLTLIFAITHLGLRIGRLAVSSVQDGHGLGWLNGWKVE